MKGKVREGRGRGGEEGRKGRWSGGEERRREKRVGVGKKGNNRFEILNLRFTRRKKKKCVGEGERQTDRQSVRNTYRQTENKTKENERKKEKRQREE